MIKYGMTALMRKVIKLRRSCHPHGMLMRMLQKKTATGYLRTVTAMMTLMVFNFLLCDCNECQKKFCTVFHVKYGGATYTRINTVTATQVLLMNN